MGPSLAIRRMPNVPSPLPYLNFVKAYIYLLEWLLFDIQKKQAYFFHIWKVEWHPIEIFIHARHFMRRKAVQCSQGWIAGISFMLYCDRYLLLEFFCRQFVSWLHRAPFFSCYAIHAYETTAESRSMRLSLRSLARRSLEQLNNLCFLMLREVLLVVWAVYNQLVFS